MIVPLAIRRLDHAPHHPGHATTPRKHLAPLSTKRPLRPARVLSTARESPGSGDDLSPGRGQACSPTRRLARPPEDVPETQGDTVTSPASGASSALALPDYAPVPRSALGPALNEQGYHVGRVERNLYWVTDGTYQAAFLTTRDGVVLFDAPPTIGHNLQRAVDEIAAAEGVSNKVTHLVYSHHHDDHAGASSLFDRNVVRVGHEETRRLLLRDNDPARPAPEVTFQDRYTLEVAGERVWLAWRGPNHRPVLPVDPLHLRAPRQARHPRRHRRAPAVHRRYRSRCEGGAWHRRPDPVLREVRGERLGCGEGLP